MENKTFIIIVTYNAMPWIERCLCSIPKQYPIIIVDNGSQDGTCNFVKNHFNQALLLEEPENLGFGQANNKGIAVALKKRCTGVFLLNQDVYLESNTISTLENCAKKYPKYGILSPLHYNGKGDVLDRNFSLYMSYDNQPNFYSDALKENLKEVYSVPFVNAAAWYLSKHTLETVGGFDPIFFHYGEDDNYVQRVLYHNLKIGVVPEVIIYHDRENRKDTIPKVFSSEYYKKREKGFKVKFANVKLNNPNDNISKQIKRISKSIIKKFIGLKWNAVRGLMIEKKYITLWATEVNKSRVINKTIGKHYL